MKSSKRSILLSLFACHPDKGSEEGVGWNWLKEISKVHQVYAIVSTFQAQEAAIQAAVEQLPQKENIHLTFVPMPRSTNWLLARFPKFEFYVQHVEWQKAALSTAQKLMQTVEIDLVHHVTYATWTIPSYLWQLQKPFVLGPVNGSQRTPLVGYQFLPPQGISRELSRLIFYIWARLPLAHVQETVRQADVVLCGNPETIVEISTMRAPSTVLLMPETGVSHLPGASEGFDGLKHRDKPQITLLWSGLIEARKNFGLLLAALQLLPADLNWKLLVAGDGPLLSHWRKQVIQQGLATRIDFLGQVPHSQMADCHQQADIFVFPSLREGCSMAVLEAMAQGLPVVALNLCGMASALADGCGILVNLGSKKQMVRSFADAIESLACDPNLRHKIAAKARQKVKREYTWESRRERMLSIYEQAFKENEICDLSVTMSR